MPLHYTLYKATKTQNKMLTTTAVWQFLCKLLAMHKVYHVTLKAAGASVYIKIAEFKCFALRNVPLCDLSLTTFEERFLSSSNPHQLSHCVGISRKHSIQSQL